MILQCPKCKKQYNVPEERLSERGVKITCPSCKHQFIVKRKHEETGEGKNKDKKKSQTSPPKSQQQTKPSRKTPPCAVCGEPSTHVFQGPPPRPLCEYHFQIEKEKDSRFFEEEPRLSDEEVEQEAPADNAITSPLRFDSQEEQHPPKKDDTVPPQVSEPVFESFDDEFDFLDDAESTDTTPVPGVSGKEISPPESKPEPMAKPGDTFGLETEEAFDTGEPPGAAASVPGRPSTDEGEESGGIKKISSGAEEFYSEEPPPNEDPFRPRATDSEGADFTSPFSADESEESGELSFKANEFLTGETADDFSEEGEKEEEDSFAFQESSKVSSGDPFSAVSMLDDAEKTAAPEPAPAKPAAAPIKVPASRPSGGRKVEQKSIGSPLLVLFLIIFATLGSAYVSYAGLADNLQSEVNAPEIPVSTWKGSLIEKADVDATSLKVSPGKGMGISLPGSSGRKAMQYLSKDTRTGYDKALARIEQALEKKPQDPHLLALRIHALAFAESVGANGEVKLSSQDARSKLNEAAPSIRKSEPLLRARAHVLVGERDFRKARDILEEYLQKTPYDSIALSLMGASYLYQDPPEPEKAIKYLEAASGFEEGPVRAQWDLALAYRMTEQYQKAEKAYELIKEKSPGRQGVESALRQVREKIKDEEPSVLDIARPQKKKVKKPIKQTGSRISRNVLEVISEVGPQIKKFDPDKARRRNAPSYRPNYAPPPEAAPQR